MGDVTANAVGNAAGNSPGGTLLSNIASGVAGAIAGGALGGPAGALSGVNGALSSDLYNRQLHPQEKTLAQQLAAASNGQYTEAQIESQMALMDVTQDGQTAYGSVRVAVGAQPQDGTDWQPYGVNQAGQQVWAQTLPSGDPDLQAYIVQHANGTSTANGLTYQATTTGSNPGLVRTPDFVNFQIDYYVGSIWGTFSRDGNSFVGGGVNMTLPNPGQISASATLGYLNSTTVYPIALYTFRCPRRARRQTVYIQ